MSESLTIKIVDDGPPPASQRPGPPPAPPRRDDRYNPDLDEAFGLGPSPPPVASSYSRAAPLSPAQQAARERIKREKFTDEVDAAYKEMKTEPTAREREAAAKAEERAKAKQARDAERARQAEARQKAKEARDLQRQMERAMKEEQRIREKDARAKQQQQAKEQRAKEQQARQEQRAKEKQAKADEQAKAKEARAKENKLREQAKGDRLAIRKKRADDRDKAKAKKEQEKLAAQANREFDKDLKAETKAQEKLVAKANKEFDRDIGTELPEDKKRRETKEQAEGPLQAMLSGQTGGAMQSAKLIGDGAMKMGPMAAVGAALPLVSVAADATAASLRKMKAGVDLAGESLATFASNERAGLGQLGEGVGQAIRSPGESLPIIGDAIKAQNEFHDAIIKLPEKLTAAFMQQAQKIGMYSGDITGANAKADVRQIMADYREAQDMGEGYGRMIDAQSRLDNTVREMLAPIKRFIVEVLATRLELMADVANVVKNLPELIGFSVDKLIEGFEAAWPGGTTPEQVIEKFKDGIKEILNRDQMPKGDFFDQFFQGAGGRRVGPVFAG